MNIPNFDDVDLGIIGIVILGVVGFFAGWLLKADTAALFAFEGTCITGIAALVRGLKRQPEAPIQPPPAP